MTHVKTLAALAASLMMSTGALAAPITVNGTPTLDIYWSRADGSNLSLVGSIDLGLNGTEIVGESQQWSWGNTNVDVINLQFVSGDVDPILVFGISVLDSGPASIFTFAFNSPLAPSLTGSVNYDLRLSGSFADGGTNGGSVGVGSNSSGFLLDGLLDSAVFASTGGGAIFASPSATYGPSINTGSVNCGAGCNTFGMTLSFLGSGSGDVHTFSGRLELNQAVVPVPGAVWLLGSALGVFGWMRRRAS
jgi:hypothetical protein